MSEDYGELVKRLRTYARYGEPTHPLMLEAADAIVTLMRERDEARQNCTLAIQANDLLCVRTNKAESRADQLAAERDSANAERFDALRSRDLAQAAAERLQAEIGRLSREG
jgi:uncharacterized protein (DUF3084 family)